MDHDDNLIIGHEQRLTRAEGKITGHDAILTTLNSSLTTLSSDFAKVKNWIIGGLSFWVINEVGITELVKGFFLK